MGMSRRWALAAGVAGAAGGVSLLGCAKRSQDLRIGVAMPLTGELAADGVSMLQAAQLAADDVNQHGTGVPGHRPRLSVVSADDEGDDAKARVTAESLLGQGAQAVIGHLTSGASIAAAPTYAARGVPQLSTATHPRFTQLGLRTTFRLVASDAVQATALGRIAASEFRGQRFAVVDDGSVYGSGLADAAARGLQAQQQAVVFRKRYDGNATNFADLVASIGGLQAGVILTTMELPQVRAIVQQSLAAGYTGLALIGGDTLKAGPLPPEARQLRRMLATTPVADVSEFGAAGRRFVERYRVRFGRLPCDAAHYAYDSVFLLAQAAARARSTEPGALAQTLRQLDSAVPITGYMRFADDGEPRFAAIGLYRVDRDAWHLVARATDW